MSPAVCANDLVREQRSEIRRIAVYHGATRVRVFGSMARGTAGPESAFDLLIDLAPGHHLFDLVAIKQDLKDLVGRPFHVVTEAANSPLIRDTILRDATPL
jgi:predicted nucleotidyltransferase